MSDKDSESPTQPNDDRNIAKVDSDTAGLTPDEQLTLIWDKYKSLVIKVAAVSYTHLTLPTKRIV